MHRTLMLGFAALLAGASSHVPAAAQSPPPARQSYTSSTTAILVDVVVRDRDGRPVTDLAAADFSVSEDGAPQKIDSFTRISRGGGIGIGVRWKTPASTAVITPPPAQPGSVAAPAAEDQEGTIALVFDHLSPEAVDLAKKATLGYVPMSGEATVRVGVFATDPGFRVLQPYTTDRARIRLAVEELSAAGSSVKEDKARRRDELTERRQELTAESQAMAAGAASGAGGNLAQNAAQLGQIENEIRMIELERSMIDSFASLDREHRGYDTSVSLLGVIRSLADMAGRKSVVLFSEGLPVTPVLAAKLDDVIDIANRANVTVYAVDARGLHVTSNLTDARKQIESFGDDRLTQVTSGSTRTDRPLTMAFEQVQDTMRLDSRTGLARLADETGGFLVEQSNDLGSAFRRIDEDNQFHYLITYSPTNTVFDGRFRTIEVRTKRPGVQVFARKGYRAIRAPGAAGRTVSYEVPALRLLDTTPLPNAFPVRAAGFSFPDPERPGMTPVVVRVATDELRFVVDPKRSTYSAQAAVVVRIRNGEGREVEKFSQEYILSGEAKDAEAARRGTILFYREPNLQPGVYTLESVVFDPLAEQGSVRVSTLTVPAAPRSGLAMSSVVLVDHVEQVGGGGTAPRPAHAAPFYAGDLLVYPNVGEPFAKSPASELPFFFTIYHAEGVSPAATAQLLRNGRVIGEAPVDLPHAAGTTLQHLGRLPLATLEPGTYELRILVRAGSDEVSRSSFFTLKE